MSLQGPAQSLLVATQPPAMHSTLVVPNRLRRSSAEMKEKVKGVGREGVKKWAKESRWKRPGQMKKQSKKATNASPRNCARATHDPASFMMATKLQSRQHASNSSSPVNQYERASHLPFSAPLPHSLEHDSVIALFSFSKNNKKKNGGKLRTRLTRESLHLCGLGCVPRRP